ncbi:MAG: hypothetical protein JXA20_15350 [Spirochaetes bacterium]|nr:hypothetical protein [Spirochaetota bacterium]
MKRILAAIAAAALMGCGTMPAITPLRGGELSAAASRCERCFPSGGVRLVQAIEADLPAGAKGSLIGVTLIRPEGQSIHSVLMSIEGLVVFEAVRERKLRVLKALPPLDNPGFAAGMMDDIALAYFRPPVDTMEAGMHRGRTLCRYRAGGGVVDVIVGDGEWRVVKYDDAGRLRREVIGSDLGGDGIPRKILLRAPGLLGYTLLLNLIESEPLR